MSKEYIEREATCKDCFHYDICLFHVDEESEKEKCMHFKNKADVVEVRHGRWIETRRGQKSPEGYYYWNTPLTTVFVCSECGRHEDKQEPYCHCGAKMDGKGEE